jgi:hypothetical protein
VGIIEYLFSDPARIMAIVGGSGGIMYWWDRFRDRPRFSVRVTDVGLQTVDLEIENTSDKANSIGSVVRLSGLDALGRVRKYAPPVPEGERSFDPFSPKTIRLRIKREPHMLGALINLEHVTVTIPTARGRSIRLRVADLKEGVSRWWPDFAVRALWSRARRRIMLRRAEREFVEFAESRGPLLDDPEAGEQMPPENDDPTTELEGPHE